MRTASFFHFHFHPPAIHIPPFQPTRFPCFSMSTSFFFPHIFLFFVLFLQNNKVRRGRRHKMRQLTRVNCSRTLSQTHLHPPPHAIGPGVLQCWSPAIPWSCEGPAGRGMLRANKIKLKGAKVSRL